MKYNIEISEIAEDEMQEAYLWYETQREGLGERLQQRIDEMIESIEDNPRKFQVRYEDVRIAFLHKFRYGIHLRIQGETIFIIGFFHTSMNPERWKDR